MKCIRCGQEIEQDMEGKTNICGSCADDLRMEEDADLLSTIASDEELARLQYEDAEHHAYEAQEKMKHD